MDVDLKSSFSLFLKQFIIPEYL